MQRRDVMKGLAAGAAIAAALDAQAAGKRKRYAAVGTGGRNRMFQESLWGEQKANGELIATCDINPGRLDYVARRAAEFGAQPPKPYLAANFDKMLRETRPDAVIVTTPDAFHDDYIVRALDAGCDVITEKPMTTTAAKAQRIIDAVKRSGKKVRVTIRRITEGGVNGNGLTSTYRTTPVSDEALATSPAKLLRSPDRRS